MGRGGAQLGKSIKGKAKTRNKEKKHRLVSNGYSNNLHHDVKALEEYERLATQAEQHRQRMRLISQQEQDYQYINKLLLHSLYRQWMRREKTASLRQQVVVLAENHAREVNRKDATISRLMCDLVVAEQQINRAQRQHMNNLSSLLSLHTQQLSQFEQDFHSSSQQLHASYSSEQSSLSTQHRQDSRELTELIRCLESEESERLSECKQSHETEREEIRNKNLEAINELRINLENRIEELERQFDEQHRFYVETTDGTNEQFKKLKSEDALLSLAICDKKKKISKLHSLLNNWKHKIALSEKEGRLRNQSLKTQKQYIQKHVSQLKQKMTRFRQTQEKQLLTLSQQATHTQNTLREQIKQAETIVRLTLISRQRETQKEQVIPFTLTQHMQHIHSHSSDRDKEEEKQQHEEDSAASPLTNFFSKYNKVLLDVLAIENEKSKLQTENMQLRAALQDYLQGIAVTPNTISKDNPLLIINGKNHNKQSNNRAGPPRLMQEGALIMQQAQLHYQRRCV